jgi:hypothetical protein
MVTLTANPWGCEEASILSHSFYIPCNRPATRLIKNSDPQSPYRMCDECADHNVRNRGAEDVGPFVYSGKVKRYVRP